MDLLYRELKPKASQEIRATRDANLIYMRPHIYKKGAPGGNLRLNLRDSDGYLIDQSAKVPISSISAQTYAHGYLRFGINTPVKEGSLYLVELEALDGYAFSDDDHVGWCKDFDLRKVNADYTPNTGTDSALDLEIWERTMADRLVEFFDGFESSSPPAAGPLTTGSLLSFIDDAAFEAYVGRPAEANDIYRNTTTGLIRFHDGTQFINLPIQDIVQTQRDINNGEVGPTAITGFAINKDNIESSHFLYTIYRRTDDVEKKETGIVKIQYRLDDGVYESAREADFDNDVGVNMDVNPATGVMEYDSDTIAGLNYKGYIQFQSIKVFTPGV